MKIKYLWSLAVAALFTGCSDYLDNVPKGEKIPTTLEDFTNLMGDEYTNHREDVTQAVILLNDRFVNSSSLSYYPLWKANYFWDESVDRIKENKADETTYYNGYAAISTANLVIENAPSATGAEADKAIAVAQAKILRARKYFTLVNYYSKTYNPSTAATDGGVPYITSAAVGAAWSQPSVQTVYDNILKDIDEALPNLPERSQNVLYADKATGYAFAARVYLQMQQYDKALENAREALSRNDKLFDWVEFYNNNSSVLGNPTVYQTISSPMGHDFVENYTFSHGSSSNQGSENQVTIARAAAFEQGDAQFMSRWKLRTVGSDTYYNSNLRGYFNKGGLTTTEVYLIEAECLARLGNISDAMDIVNKVRKMRILPAIYQPLTAASVADAVKAVIKVKANALIQTIVPFCDARRLNLDPTYAQTLSKQEGGTTYTLLPTSEMWTMPFPQGAVSNPGNGTLTQNVSK